MTTSIPAGTTSERFTHDAAPPLLLHFSRNTDAYADPRGLLVLERGEGPRVWDEHGTEYLDALSSLYCAQLGYSYGDEMADAAATQLRTLAYNSNWSTAHRPALNLAERLADLAPGDLSSVFFTSGGSESVEAAWKLARLYFEALGQSGRTKAIARNNAYHGVTLGALAFTGIASAKEPFGPPAVDVSHAANTNAYRSGHALDDPAFTERLLTEMRQVVAQAGPDEVAMIIAEPVQNAGGCLVPPPGYWAGLRQIADECGALLVADEVITGFGRVGEWFASTRLDVVPDMITCAKGLTSAYAPMGATIVRAPVAAAISAGHGTLKHGVTFGGHPLCAAIALRNLELFERDGVLQNVRDLEGYLETSARALAALPIVGDVRGMGFFWAFELVKDDAGTRFDAAEREELLRAFLPGRLRDAGLIARADDRGDAVLQIAPPLICDAETLDDIVGRVGEVLADATRHMRLDG